MAIEEFIARKISPDGSTGTSKATIENHVVTFENSESPSPYITEIKTLNGVSLVGSGNYDFDSALNEASTNAVQNKVITEFANDVAGTYVTKIELYEALKRGEVSSEVEKVYTNEINYIAENVMPSGKVTKILGKTEKSENLFVYDRLIHSGTTNGVSWTMHENGEIVLNGTLESNDLTIILGGTSAIQSTFENGKTYISKTFNTNIVSYLQTWDAVNGVQAFSNSTQFIMPQVGVNQNFALIIKYTAGTTLNNAIVYPMLVKGTTAPTTWSQGYTGLKHTHITGLKTTGINLWDEEWELGGILSDTGLNYAKTDRIRSTNYIEIVPSTTYYFKSGSGLLVYWYDIDKTYLGTRSFVNNATLASPDNAYYARWEASSAYGTTYNHDICINISDANINGNYYPYEEETLNVNFEGNGVSTVSDEINVEEGKKYQRMFRYNLGDLNYQKASASGREGWFQSSGLVDTIKFVTNNSQIANLICSIYTTDTANNVYQRVTDRTIGVSTTGYLQIYDSRFAEVADIKQFLQGVYIVAELATPIITDVEIENDGWLSNLIKDGSITQKIDTTDSTALIAKEVDIAVNVVVDNQ